MTLNFRLSHVLFILSLASINPGCGASDSDSTDQIHDASIVAEDSGMEPAPTAGPATPTRALTPTEYNNTVRDLLSMPLDPRRWPQPPAIAAQLSPTPRERSGLFGSPAPPPAPWPWLFPPEAGVDEFEGMVEGR